ncbi:mechanosensitive ion channel family protein [Membranihabitans marinus]|uniref:mechanosensitive ion channel family protein n=1 Tax=Membranihabitans marinus TaxID=1227546 RepID=UPI001F0169D6|nr:mechanosensitive ion channel domain-containing protein [Membranihabitans marinus]
MEELLKDELQIANQHSISAYIILGLGVVLVYLFYRLLLRLGLKFISVDKGDIFERKIRSILKYLWILFSLQIILFGLKWNQFSILEFLVEQFKLDWNISKEGFRIFEVSKLIYGLIIFQFAKLLDWILTRFINTQIVQTGSKSKIKKYLTQEEAERKTNVTVQYLAYGIAAILIINSFNLDFVIVSFPSAGDSPLTFKLSNLISVINIMLVARLLNSLFINIFLRKLYTSKGLDIGRQYSFNQLLTYFVYIIAVLFAFRSLGYNTTIIFGGLAALLVGVGIGLQQTFNDFFSGILLLFERSIEIGNVIEVEGQVAEVEKIGLRTSFIRNRNNIIMIVPNSILVNGQITNWSHMDSKARFYVEFGVAYDTDLVLFEKILLEEAKKLDDILPYPSPRVQTTAIAASTYNIRLLFWTQNFMQLPDLQSRLRNAVINACRTHKIEMAYDQLDIRFKNEIIARPEADKSMRITPLSPDREFE